MQVPTAALKKDHREKPILTYNGLTIVMSHGSRFDRASLLSANGGNFFCNDCLGTSYNRMGSDIRLKDNREPLLPNTKCVLLLGEPAAQTWLGNVNNTLNEIRGSPYLINNVPHVASYQPQDACDTVKDHELKYNPYLNGEVDSASTTSNDEDETDDEDKDESEEKQRHGRTKRKNYRFWLQQDVEKCKRIIEHGGIPAPAFPATYELCPSSQSVIRLLTQTKNKLFFIDIETDTNWNILCFSFAFDYGTVYIVPCLDHNYKWYYSSLHQIYRALAIAIRDNTTIAHNGSGFDFFVFALRYHIAIGKSVADTMLQQHRCFPECEKSLGHCTSKWTYEPFHKDEADFSYGTPDNCAKLWKYNGKDVYTMMLIYKAQIEYAKRNPGLLDSFNQANASIRPYLITSLMGMQYRDDKVEEIMKYNDRMMMQYIRMIEIMIGKEWITTLRKKGKSSLCASNTQCVEYFHNLLGYDVVGKGKTKKDGTQGASLQKKNLLKLRLKYENPVIDVTMAYRETAKESGSLKFIPLKTRQEIYAPNLLKVSM